MKSALNGEDAHKITYMKQDLYPGHTWDLDDQRERQVAELKEELHRHLQGRYTEASQRTSHR